MIPETIYHYTTIETLALILKSGKIRFNSINRLDDLTEPLSKDFGNIGSLILVSCWTDIGEESIAQWNLYSKNGTGCRIELPSDLFTRNMGQKTDKYFATDKELSLLYPVNNLFRIEYKSSIELKNIRKEDKFDFSEIGKTKNNQWAFQSEWRFILYQLSKEMFDSIKNSQISELKDFSYKYDYYDMEIRSEIFQKMKITLGPETTNAEEIIVNALISKYNNNATVKISKLKDIIKLKN
ncbi:DUF2971 domain-containing protein [Leeuwenhoekiella nanhaiensis]|uniref:DUF2971 domain-containing protein n=1 Tax=Leeuwenhoekiella nanhaiensis TaxID=1655491 RepID=A0A2G1VMQ8_9FLAO|nr:DUF2971 domain-containing protein [Leeuwenhoekiella nanhaiensis]PHQ28043.1 hypothetical protein CJ305_17200 [Leeuwenhoekiella nanhaiensis]